MGGLKNGHQGRGKDQKDRGEGRVRDLEKRVRANTLM